MRNMELNLCFVKIGYDLFCEVNYNNIQLTNIVGTYKKRCFYLIFRNKNILFLKWTTLLFITEK